MQRLTIAKRRLSAEVKCWIAERLASGCEPSAVSASLEQLGFHTRLVKTEVARALQRPFVGLARKYSHRAAKMAALLRLYESILEKPGDLNSIPTHDRLDTERFYRDFYHMNRPVVITGLLATWPALKSWTPDYFTSRFGHVPIQISDGRDEDPEYETHFDDHVRCVLMKDFIARLVESGKTNDFYLAAKNNAFQNPELRVLLDDLTEPIDYLVDSSDWKQRSRLWIGPTGTLTPLHHDLKNLLFAQVFGRKHFKLISALSLPCVYNHRGPFSQVNPEAPDLARFPLFRHVRVHDVVLKPGDVLFLPVAWWHWVKALDISVSITFQSFRETNALWEAGQLVPADHEWQRR